MKTVTFEQACEIQYRVLSPENIKTLGIAEVYRLRDAHLAEVGWTSEELINESERRVVEKFKSNPFAAIPEKDKTK